MELLLNLLWFGIAGGALVLYLRGRASDHRHFLLGLAALLCVLTLLLPAISITDDLHFDALAVEDSSTLKRLANAVTHAGPMSQVVWFGISLLAMLFAARRRSTWRLVGPSFVRRPESQFMHSFSGRAPPAVLA